MQTRARLSCPPTSLINYLHNRRINVTRKSLAIKEFGRKFILGFSAKILKLACFVLFVRNGEGHLQVKRLVDDKVNCKELAPLLQTLSKLYESSGGAEPYGIYSLLASVNGVTSSYLLSEVLCALHS